MSALPAFNMRQLLDAGVHFGHKTNRWNPRMEPFIFGERNNIHIIDLQQTVPMLHQALNALREVAAKNGRILFVGTKRQASEVITETAKRCGQYYVNHRWLGGMLTNWHTVSASIKTLQDIENELNDEGNSQRSKKELLNLARQRDKLELSLGGIKTMGGTPDMLFIVDTNRESLAVTEAQKLGIPIVAVLDTNSNPDGITYPVPGNDDASRSIKLYCDLACDAILSGIEQSLAQVGADVGASENPPAEKLPKAKAAKEAAKPAAKKADADKKKAAPKEAEAKEAEEAKKEAAEAPAAKEAEAKAEAPADAKEEKAEEAAKAEDAAEDTKKAAS